MKGASPLIRRQLIAFSVAAVIGAIVLTLRERVGIKRQSVPVQNARTKEAAMEVKQVPSHAGVPEEMA